MNCFDWQNRASDYLDGAMTANTKKEADQHVDQCALCNKRYQHYRLILTSISGQPRKTLPLAIRKSPHSPVLKRDRKFSPSEKLSQWLRTPWYIRTPVEGASLVLAISIGISAGPRLRNFYESKIEKSLSEYGEVTSNETEADQAARLTRGNLLGDQKSAADDFAGSEDSGDAAEGSDSDDNENAATLPPDQKPLQAGSKDTWRFNLKTDSPHDVRNKIVGILRKLNVPTHTHGLGGIEAPGGIQFDLFVPAGIITDLKQELQKIAPTPPKELADSPIGETFTWYKRKSKLAAPAGQTHVVIWLAQI